MMPEDFDNLESRAEKPQPRRFTRRQFIGIGGAVIGAGIAAVTARPFGKYVLNNWRKMWGYKK